MFLVENPVGASSWNQASMKRLRNAPFSFEGISHFCMFGVKDLRSRRPLKRPQLLKFVVRECLNKHVRGLVKRLTNAYRSSSRWHTRAWAQAVIRGVESDAVKRHEAYPAEDVEMDLSGADIPDDEFREEPHVEEVRVPKEVPNAVKLAILRTRENLGHPSKELHCRALRIGGANEIAIRAANELKCDVFAENNPPETHLPSKLADTYTEFNQGVGVYLFVLADSNEQVFRVPEHCRYCHEVHRSRMQLPWSPLDEKQSGELASLELPDHSPESGRRRSGLWAVRRAFETMDTSHRVRRALYAGVRASSHTHRSVTGELVLVWRRVKKNRTDARTALVTHQWYGPAIVFGKEKNNVFVSYGGRVTKVAPECLRKASVAEQKSWDITTKEKALFETALDEENLLWEEPLLDESSEFTRHDGETAEDVNSPMNDDGDLPFSDRHLRRKTITVKTRHKWIRTEESRDVVHGPMRLPRHRLRSKHTPPSVEPEEGVESKSKKSLVNCQSCCTMHFSQKLDPQRSNGLAQNGVRSCYSLRPLPSNGMHGRKTLSPC